MSSQQQIPIYEGREPSEETKQVMKQFSDMESRQLEFLDEACKSIIERISTFMAVLFGVTVLGNNFPPPYLKDNLPAKLLIIATLLCYLFALAAGMLAIQPRRYRFSQHNVTENMQVLDRMLADKLRGLRVAGIAFGLGSLALGGLIVVIILKV